MPRHDETLPNWVPIAAGLLLAGAIGGPLIVRLLDASRAQRPDGAASTQAIEREAVLGRASSPPAALRVSAENLGAPKVSRFAFDPAVPGRVVACGRESRDGGRTWTGTDAESAEWAELVGERMGAPAVPGPRGRVLCGDVILPGEARPAGVVPLRIAAEWTEAGWRDAGLPIAHPDPRRGDTSFDVALGYAPDGTPFAVRGDRVVGRTRSQMLPGAVDVWAMDDGGGAYAAVRRSGRRPHLVWAPGIGGPWQSVTTPGDVRALAVDGDHAYAAAGMLGRGSRGTWDWTRWPANVTISGLSARRRTVVAWGEMAGDKRGGYVVSRDGGATLGLAVHGPPPAWAALDPFAPSELLVLGQDRGLTRLRIE